MTTATLHDTLSKLISVKSWCDACAVRFERTGSGCDGHFMCTKPEPPEGYRLTGDKELTPTGWREEARPFSPLGPEITYLAAADVPANEAAVFPAIGEAFPAPGGWTYQGIIGQRALLGEFDTPEEAQTACDAWLREPARSHW